MNASFAIRSLAYADKRRIKMQITMLKGKIHRAIVQQAELN